MTASGVQTPSDDDALFREARAAWDRGEAASILPRLDAALPRSSDYRLWHIHGLILRNEGRQEEAIKSLARATQLSPQARNPAQAYAHSLYEAGLPSVDAYVRAVRVAPGDPELLLGLATALAGERRVDEAIAGLVTGLERWPDWIPGHITLTKLRWMNGEREGFARSFAAAAVRSPRNIDLRRQHIIALVHAEEWQAVLQAIAEGRAAIGNDPAFDLNEAIVHSESGDTTRADALFAQLASRPEPDVQLRRVRHFLRSGRVEEASALIDSWLSTDAAAMFWPYASTAWRLLGDERWEWLEGNPRLVGVYDIADRLPPLDALAESLRKYHTARGQLLEQSVRGGTQTDGNLFAYVDPCTVAVREAVREVVKEHIAQLPPFDQSHPTLGIKRSEVRFSGAWSVWLRSSGFHANHVHPAGWLSSALYVVLPPSLGEGDAGCLTLGEPQAQLGLTLPPTRVIRPEPGRLALFPSWMWHGTRPFPAGERMTVAFDVARPQ